MTMATPQHLHTLSSPITDSDAPKAAHRRHFLVVEDEPDIADLLALHLEDLNAEVTIAHDGVDGLQQALMREWDAILLDLQLPGIDGLDICKAIRHRSDLVPIVMLTSRGTELDRVLGLEIGADDYLVKPFSIPELKARLKALLRRARHAHALHSTNPPYNADEGVTHQSEEEHIISAQGLSLNQRARSVHKGDRCIELTAREFDLLSFFMRHPGVVFRRAELLDEVWGYGHEGYEHTVNSHINRLRAKLESDPAHPTLVATVWGVGYRFGPVL